MRSAIRIICIALAIAVCLAVTAPIASSDLPMPPMPPSLPPLGTPTPTPSGGGGGPSGPGPVTFQKYVVDIKTTDGILIGNITANSPDSLKLWVERIVPIGSYNYTVRMTADLDAVPQAPQMDILAAAPGAGKLLDSDEYTSLAAFNITRYSKSGNWKLKAGTVNLYVTAPAEALNGTDTAAPYYLLKNDTSRDIVYPAARDNGDGTVTFSTLLWYEPGSPADTGIYSLLGKSVEVLPEPTVTPTAAPSPTGTASADTEGSNVFATIGVLILGLILGLLVALGYMYLANKK
ncbi:hypothetical protein [Methanocella arvoryzae]|uniref:Uncharacterized protein n=1 Tax=Methanocella arvoryzae (strain DSM 22066 / NBRC 105507 / MRE50) TaxID=351160 RepID=Q0W4I5_METAR|nr:hypothetical protein [Methanocella arvoryzae]CAJ36708.1 hypothetical protein RCIX1440 [Methanocella arvoryzae MRE50]